MLKITLASYTADLDEAQLSIVMTSPFPLMAAGLDGGNYIYNFSLPATPELKKTFQHAHRPGAMAGYVEVPFKIDASGIRYDGTATLAEAGDDSYEVMCPVANGSFNMRSKEVRLPALDLGGEAGSQLPPLVAEVGVPVYLHEESSSGFLLTKTIPFRRQIANCGELSAAGTQITATSGRDASITILLDAAFFASSCELQLFQNDTMIASWSIITGAETLLHNFSLANEDSLRIDVVVSAEGVNGDDMYVVNAVIYNGTRITLGAAQLGFLMDAGANNRWPDVNFACFPVENPRIFDAWPDDHFSVDNVSIKTLYSEYFKVINYWHGGTFPATQSIEVNDETYVAGNLFVPFPYIAFLVQRIANYFSFRIINNVFDDELKYAVLINFFVENSFLSDDPTQMTPNDSFRMNDHVPDWSVYEFVQHLCNLFGLGYEVDDEMQTITFTFLQDLLTSVDYVDISHLVVAKPRADWQSRITGFILAHEYPDNDALKDEIKSLEGLTLKGFVLFLGDLPTAGNAVNDCWWVAYSYAYYAWQYDPETYQFAWVFHSRRHKLEISSGTDPDEITTQLPAVLNVWHTVPELKAWLIPASHQPGNFEGAPDAYAGKWQPLVAWYHGLQEDSEGDPYPYASAANFDKDYAVLAGAPFSIKLDEWNNIYVSRWRDFLEWRRSAKPVRVQIIPDRVFLKNFRFSQKVRFGGVTYLVAELRGNIGRLGPDVWEMLLLVV